MPSNIHHVDLRKNDTYIIGQMLKKANYATAELRPLTGPLHDTSKSILKRFIAATMRAPGN